MASMRILFIVFECFEESTIFCLNNLIICIFSKYKGDLNDIYFTVTFKKI